MNNQVHVDAELLRKFADHLARFSDAVSEMDQKMSHELTALGEHCRDRDYDEFRDHYVHSRHLLTGFVEHARNVIPDLRKDAQLIEEAQSIRLDH